MLHIVAAGPRYNFTDPDPDSRIMKSSNKGWDQSNNAQALVDESQFIVAANVTQQANDVRQVTPLLDKLEGNFEAADITDRPQDLVADAGYYSDANAADVRSRDMTPYIATQRLKHHEELSRGRIPKSLIPKQRMPRTLRTKPGRNAYRNERDKSNPPCSLENQHSSQIKQATGFRQFSQRGLQKMNAE